MFHFDFNQNLQDHNAQILETRKLFNKVHENEKETQQMKKEVASKPENLVNNDEDIYHEQTLAPQKKNNIKGTTSDINDDNEQFTYESDGYILAFQKMSDDFIMKCPLCKSETKYIVRHIVHCSDHVNQAAFKAQFQIYKEEKRKKDQVDRKRKSRARQREEDEKKYKENQAKEKR